MKIISYNVNGIATCYSKGLVEFMESEAADFYCFQECRTSSPYEPIVAFGEHNYWNCSSKKGYAGVCCLAKEEPISVSFGLGNPTFDSEGRLITLEYPDFYLVNCYVPNSVSPLSRYHFRLAWDRALREYLCDIQEYKPVIVCGDFNVAYDYIDVYPENERNEKDKFGMLEEERDGMMQLLESGLVDCYRYLYPDKEGSYTWWSSKNNNREMNRGRRLDYFLMSEEISYSITDCGMYPEIKMSDHSPIFLGVNI